jgi:hypothetical protein
MRALRALFPLALALVASCDGFVWNSSMPPRLQWLSNDGYCGEVSTIAAGLALGGCFLSQYDLRAIATGGVQTGTWYKVGLNDVSTAKQLRLRHIEYQPVREGAPRSGQR